MTEKHDLRKDIKPSKKTERYDTDTIRLIKRLTDYNVGKTDYGLQRNRLVLRILQEIERKNNEKKYKAMLVVNVLESIQLPSDTIVGQAVIKYSGISKYNDMSLDEMLEASHILSNVQNGVKEYPEHFPSVRIKDYVNATINNGIVDEELITLNRHIVCRIGEEMTVKEIVKINKGQS